MPDFQKLVRERLAALHMDARAEAELGEELAQHLEDHYRELRSGGASEAAALRQALAEMDDLHPLETSVERMPKHDAVPIGDTARGSLLADLWRDLRYTGRTIRTSPLFVLFVVATLALGIGANTTVFTVVDTFILNPLPVHDAATLAAITAAQQKGGGRASDGILPISYANLKDYRSENQVFDSLAGYSSVRPLILESGTTSQRIFGEIVTGNYFSTLGLTPAKGRFFAPDEDSIPGTHPVAVMSYGAWQQRFGGADDVIGRTLRIDNVDLTVIGVAPPKFIGLNAIFGPDLWIPAAMAETLFPVGMRRALDDRSSALFLGVGRLRPGISRSRAQADITAISASLARQYPQDNEGHTATVRPIGDVLFGSAGMGRASLVSAGFVLLIVVGIVLLIACSNVANLLLARASARQQEIAVRLAMGASRGRLIRQMLTESLTLGLLSGIAGIAVGWTGTRMLWSFTPGANFINPRLDSTVLGFSLAVSLVTGFLFGIMPALRVSRVELADTLKNSRTAGRGRGRITFANSLLVGQVAFSFLSLVIAALFLRSIQHAYDIDPGFQTRNLAILMTNPGQAGYQQPQATNFYRDAAGRVARLPGVESVSWASNLPLWGRMVNGLEVEGRQARSKSDTITTAFNTVDVGYFETDGVAVLRGRGFVETDREGTLPVAIVNEKLVHDFWPDVNPLGKHIRLPGETEMRQVIGVVKTGNYSTLAEPPEPCVYVPLRQHYSDAMVLYVRTSRDPQPLLMSIQREVRAAGPQVWVDDIRTGTTIVDQGLFTAKIAVGLLSVFGVIALGLASIGLYGIIAYSVNRRRREIGVRMALGAGRRSVMALILREGMTLVAAGVAIGMAAALFAGRLLARMLFGVGAGDPISIAGAALVLFAVALAACYLPARSASRLDPLATLREG